MKNIYLVAALFLGWHLAAQVPVNDNFATPTALGILPDPGPCGSGLVAGTTVTLSGTNVNATHSNPYIGGCNYPYSATNDVWYTFTAPANGNGVNITVSGGTLVNADISLFYGTVYDSLEQFNCVQGNSNNGAVLYTPDGLVPGQTYNIRVSGDTTAEGTFNLSVYAFHNCNSCLNAAHLTATPLPVNGTYQPGQTVSFCYHVDQWTQTDNNWLHGVELAFGDGWNLSTLITNSPPSYIANAAHQGGGAPATCGYWAYYPNGEVSEATNITWPAGFYFNGTYSVDAGTGLPDSCTSATDGNPGNNFGDGIPANDSVFAVPDSAWLFCWTIAVAQNCDSGTNLSVQVNTSGDGESGSWSNVGCVNDPAVSFLAQFSCCTGTCCAVTISSNPTAGDSICAGMPITFTATPSGYSNYLFFNNDTILQDSSSATFTTATLTNGNNIYAKSTACAPASDSISFSFKAPVLQSICQASFDTVTYKNVVVWNKADKFATDIFYIYRADSTDTAYNQIAALNRDSLSEYEDITSAPATTSYRYKINLRDTCGNLSLPSNYHQTIYLQSLPGGNFAWTPYEVENTPSPVSYYNFYRDTSGTGNWQLLDSLPASQTSVTISDYALYPNARYVVMVNLTAACSPSRSASGTIFSNICSSLTTAVSQVEDIYNIRLLYNPTHEKAEIINITQPARLQLTDNLGQVLQTNYNAFNKAGFNLDLYAPGLYFVKVNMGSYNTTLKVVKY